MKRAFVRQRSVLCFTNSLHDGEGPNHYAAVHVGRALSCRSRNATRSVYLVSITFHKLCNPRFSRFQTTKSTRKQVHEAMFAFHKQGRAYSDEVSLENPINIRHRLVQVQRNSPTFVDSTTLAFTSGG